MCVCVCEYVCVYVRASARVCVCLHEYPCVYEWRARVVCVRACAPVLFLHVCFAASVPA